MKVQYLCHPAFLLLTIGVAVTCGAAEPVRDNTPANDFPTQARVEYVNQCISNNGGRLAALYQCSCAIDHIANNLTYDEYVEVTTYIKNLNMPGEGGGMFRDSELGRKLVKNYRELESAALRNCGVSH